MKKLLLLSFFLLVGCGDNDKEKTTMRDWTPETEKLRLFYDKYANPIKERTEWEEKEIKGNRALISYSPLEGMLKPEELDEYIKIIDGFRKGQPVDPTKENLMGQLLLVGYELKTIAMGQKTKVVEAFEKLEDEFKEFQVCEDDFNSCYGNLGVNLLKIMQDSRRS